MTVTQVFSSADVGSKTGFGFPIHRMAKYFELNASGIDMYIINQGNANTRRTEVSQEDFDGRVLST